MPQGLHAAHSPLPLSLAACLPKPSKMVESSKEAKLEIGEDGVNPELVACIEKLQEVQEELERIDEEESEKVLEVERECNEKCRPIYVRRNEIIRSIPDFWLTAFLNHPALCELLNERDQKILKHLVSLEVDDIKSGNSGYFIAFNFSANPYFENTTLTKTYSFGEGTTGTTIDWKEGMDIVNKVAQKKAGKRPHVEESFFSWFSITQQRNISEGIFDEVGITIKEDIWPNPLKYFNNEVDEEDFDDEDDDDNEEKGTDDNEDDDGDDDAEEEEDDED